MGTRVLSMIEGLLLAGFAAIAFRRRGAPAWLAVLIGIAVLSNPAFRFTYRTLRYEQDLFFVGALGLLLPHIALSPARAGRVWMAAGVLTGMAVSMHPRGVLFAVLQAVNLGLCHRGWRGIDGTGFWKRSLVFAAGALIPVGYTATWYAVDWTGTSRYIEGLGHAYPLRDPQNVSIYKNYYAWPSMLKPPDRLRASINTLLMAAEPRGPTGRFLIDGTVRAAGWGCLFLMYVMGSISLVRGIATLASGAGPKDAMLTWLPILIAPFVAATYHAFSMPADNYVVYAETFAVLAAGTWTFLALPGTSNALSGRLRPTRGVLCAVGLYAYVAVLLGGGWFGAVRAPAPWWWFDEDYAAQRALSERLGLAPERPEGKAVYTDFVSWAAGGRRAYPSFEYMIWWPGVMLQPRAAWILDSSVNSSLFQYPAAMAEQPAIEERIKRQGLLLEGLHLAGAILYQPREPGSVTHRLWYVAEDPAETSRTPESMEISWMFLDRREDYTARPFTPSIPPALRDRPDDSASASFDFAWSVRLPPGRFLISCSSLDAFRSHIYVHGAEPGSPVPCEGRMFEFPQDRPVNLVPLRIPGGSEGCDLVVQARMRDYKDGVVPSASLHIWALEPLPR